MQINQRQLRLECLDYGMKRIAKALDIKPNTATIKLKNPTQTFMFMSSFRYVRYWEIHPKKRNNWLLALSKKEI